MGTISPIQSARSSSFLNLGTLASATYIASSAYNASTNDPDDVIIEVEANANGTPSGNKQLLVFGKASLDNSNFQSGPESGTTATEENDLTLIGVLPMNDTNDHRKFFSLRQAFGFVPAYFKIVCKNDLGVALTSGNVYTAEVIETTS